MCGGHGTGSPARAGLTAAVWALSLSRILLCLAPQNRWTSADAPLSWGIYRNIPFALLGLLIVLLFYRSARRHGDRAFRFLWLAVLLSFAFYLPVVLFADALPPGRHADDPQNLRLRLDGRDGLPGDERRTLI